MVTLLIKMLRSMESPPYIVLELLDSDPRSFVLPPPHMHQQPCVLSSSNLDVLRMPSTVYICDVSAEASGIRYNMAAFAIVIVSPHSKQSKTFSSWVKNAVPKAVLFMPIWRLDELEACRRLCFPTKAEREADLPSEPSGTEESHGLPGQPWPYELSAEKLLDRFARFGGSARLVLAEKMLDSRLAVSLAITNCDLSQVADQTSTASLELLPTSSSCLLHYDVRQEGEEENEEDKEDDERAEEKDDDLGKDEKKYKEEEGDAGPYTVRAIKIASQSIAHQLWQKKKVNHRNTILEFIETTCGSKVWSGASGMMFEHEVAHGDIHMGGSYHSGYFRVQQFDSPTPRGEWPYGKPREESGVQWMHIPSSRHLPILEFDKVAQLNDAADGQYAKPRAANFPTIDGFLLPNMLCQMTVSAQHDINVPGLLSAVNALRTRQALNAQKAGQQPPAPDKPYVIHFFFVVPFAQFANFKPGAFTPRDKEEKAKSDKRAGTKAGTKASVKTKATDTKAGALAGKAEVQPRPDLPPGVEYHVLCAYEEHDKEPTGNGQQLPAEGHLKRNVTDLAVSSPASSDPPAKRTAVGQ